MRSNSNGSTALIRRSAWKRRRMDAAVEHIVQRHQAHSLVVSHVGVNDDSLPALPLLLTRVVHRFIEAHAAVHPGLYQSLEIPDRFRRIHQQCQRGGIRRDHQVLLQPPFQAE